MKESSRLTPCAAIFLLTVVLLSLTSPASAICYYPDGSEANDTPCTSETANSTCCGTGYACLGTVNTFFLCVSTGDEIQKSGASTYVRGSCTDSTWRSANCPAVCINPTVDDTAGGEGVAICPNSKTEFYCIDSLQSEVNCTTGSYIFEFAQTPSIITTIGVASSSSSSSRASSSSTTSSTLIISSSSTTFSSSTISSSSTSPSSPTSSSSSTIPSSSTPSSFSYSSPSSSSPSSASGTALATIPTSTSPTPVPSKSGENIGLGVGLGVGLGLGLLGISGVIAILLLKRRRLRQPQQGPPPYDPSSPAMSPYGHHSINQAVKPAGSQLGPGHIHQVHGDSIVYEAPANGQARSYELPSQ